MHVCQGCSAPLPLPSNQTQTCAYCGIVYTAPSVAATQTALPPTAEVTVRVPYRFKHDVVSEPYTGAVLEAKHTVFNGKLVGCEIRGNHNVINRAVRCTVTGKHNVVRGQKNRVYGKHNIS